MITSTQDPLASSPLTSVLDVGVLHELAKLDPAAPQRFIDKVLAAFEDSLNSQTQAVDAWRPAQALPSVPWDQVGRCAHTLKSAARSIGAHGFANVCSELEEAARRNDAPACARAWPRWWLHADALRDAVRAHRTMRE